MIRLPICRAFLSLILFMAVASSTIAWRAEADPEPAKLTREQVIEQTMKPFDGTSKKGVDCSTLKGKVLCGYQGWHAAEGDGCGRGWYHWKGKNGFKDHPTKAYLASWRAYIFSLKNSLSRKP